jgi:hypothetical protein
MGRQGPVQLIQLFAAGGGHGDGHPQVFAALAFAQFDGRGIKGGVKLVGDQGDGVHQSLHFDAHDFDGEKRRVLNERLVGGDVGVDRCGHGVQYSETVGFNVGPP